MSLLVEKFNYLPLPKVTCEQTGKRVYDTPDGSKLPSVTTILDATEDKTALYNWRRRVGKEEANFITKTSAGIGNYVHKHLENYIRGEDRPTGTSFVRKMSALLADIVIEEGLVHIDEVWGLEAPLYYPGLYAGTADVIGIWKGEPALIDFKNTRKPKKKEWITNYFLQLTAYSMAHNELFETEIKKGVILMVAREEPHVGEMQIFEIDIPSYEHAWLDTIEKYYSLSDK